MNISRAVAVRMCELAKEKKLTHYKLAQKSGIPLDTIKSISKGKAKGVNLRTVIAIADGLGMTASQFLTSDLFLYDNLNMD